VGQIQLRHAVAGVIRYDLEQGGQRSIVLSSCPQHLRPLQLELGNVGKLQDGFFQPVVDGFVIAEQFQEVKPLQAHVGVAGRLRLVGITKRQCGRGLTGIGEFHAPIVNPIEVSRSGLHHPHQVFQCGFRIAQGQQGFGAVFVGPAVVFVRFQHRVEVVDC